MAELLDMDADTVSGLLTDYDLSHATTREDNMNKFMRFCNIGYQVRLLLFCVFGNLASVLTRR